MKSYAQYFYSDMQPLEEGSCCCKAIIRNKLLKKYAGNSFNDLTQKDKTIFNSEVVHWLMIGSR